MWRETCQFEKKTEDGKNVFFKGLTNRYGSTSKLITCVKEQKGCLWPTAYQMNFMKR